MKRTKRTKEGKKPSPKKYTRRELPQYSKLSGLQFTRIYLLIILIWTVAAYYPSLQGELTNWDDNRYITDNPYLKSVSPENIKAIFSEQSYMGNYHPLTMLSLAIDYQIGGEDEEGNVKPFIFKLVNLLLHLITTILVFFFTLKLLKNANITFITALLFGIHSLHVESVAWISERKDVLYAAFFMASLLSYLYYLKSKKISHYLFSLFLFVLSLLSKGQAVSLAVTLVALDLFYLRKDARVKIILEKLPFFILALIFGILAIKAQQEGEALVVGESYNILQRISIASYGFTMYFMKLILPVNLSAIYPYPDIVNQTVPYYYTLSIAVPAAVIFIFFKSLKQNRVLAFSIAFFVINIALLLQLIPVGSAIYADRYAYIPSVGFYLLLAYFLDKWYQSLKLSKLLFYTVLGVYAALLVALTFERSKVWQTSELLWDDTVEKAPEAVVARNNRGSLKNTKAEEYAEKGLYDLSVPLRHEAIADFDVAIRIKPDYVHALYNRGATKLELGKNTRNDEYIYQAQSDFNLALEIDPAFAEAFHNRANAKSELNNLEGALIDYNNAIQIDPDKAEYYINRGVCFGKLGRLEESVVDIEKAIQMNPENASAYANLGRAHAGMENYQEAVKNYTRAIDLDPAYSIAFFNRGIALWRTGELNNAVQDFTKALELDTEFTDALLMRGQVYIELNQNNKACDDFTKAAVQGSPNGAVLLELHCKNE